MCPYNLLVSIQHPQNRGRGSSTAYMKLKKLNFWPKNNYFWPLFHEKWQVLVHTHAVNCVFVIYMPLQPAFSYPAPFKWRGGVFNCLSDAKRTQFLTGKRPFFAIFHEKRPNLVHTDAVNCDFLLCVCLHPASLHPAPSKWGGGGLQLLVWGQKRSIFDQKTATFGQFFMKNGKFWYIQMLQIVFSSSVCPNNLLFCIQHPQNGRGGLRMLVWRRKNSIFDQKTAILGRFFFHEK